MEKQYNQLEWSETVVSISNGNHVPSLTLNFELCCLICYRLMFSGLYYMATVIFNSCIDPWIGSWPLSLQLRNVSSFFLISQVVPVSYVRFSTSPVLYTHTGESLKAFPLGVILTFIVHFHASTGEALHSSGTHLTFSTNRSVTHSIGSSTLIIIFHELLSFINIITHSLICPFIDLCILCDTVRETWLLERGKERGGFVLQFASYPKVEKPLSCCCVLYI